ncbi:hypothetical protein ACHAWC_002063 [Mediolabrus comicus]
MTTDILLTNKTEMFMVYGYNHRKTCFPSTAQTHISTGFWYPSVASGQGRLCTIHSESTGDDKGKKKKNFDWDIKLSSK